MIFLPTMEEAHAIVHPLLQSGTPSWYIWYVVTGCLTGRKKAPVVSPVSDHLRKEIITRPSTEEIMDCLLIHLNWLVKASSSLLSWSRMVLTFSVMSSKLCWTTLSRSLLTLCRRSSLFCKISSKYLSRS